MTQRELAGRVGISRQTMNAIENCRHAPTVIVAIRIADVFHVSVDQLFELDYDGKTTRRKLPQPEQAATVEFGRSRATAEKPIELKNRYEPPEESTPQTDLASLRNIIES